MELVSLGSKVGRVSGGGREVRVASSRWRGGFPDSLGRRGWKEGGGVGEPGEGNPRRPVKRQSHASRQSVAIVAHYGSDVDPSIRRQGSRSSLLNGTGGESSVPVRVYVVRSVSASC